jgi:hypothetical protein
VTRVTHSTNAVDPRRGAETKNAPNSEEAVLPQSGAQVATVRAKRCSSA